MEYLREVIRKNRSGQAIALPSVCSAHPSVLKSSLMLAAEHGQPLLVEATSNQVNQFGGYTGMRPGDFVGFVHRLCDDLHLPRNMVLLGGDHLGPQVWKRGDAETAMANAAQMMREYVQAGFTKIHLDCSEGCVGEPAQVGNEISAERAARLAKICEEAAPDPSALSYIVGTEVPPPGGARAEEGDGVTPTRSQDAVATIKEHQAQFEKLELEDAWARVAALVVQPGLEFGPDHIERFEMSGQDRLSDALKNYPNIAFEAHSTDYQFGDVFPDLARRHFAVLKVGPALTFAYREAIYALDHIAKWLGAGATRNSIVETMDHLMQADHAPWQDHYQGAPSHVALMRHFGYADRIRYFWNHPQAIGTVAKLKAQINASNISDPLLRQYFSTPVLARAEKSQKSGSICADALITASIQEALAPYFFDVSNEEQK